MTKENAIVSKDLLKTLPCNVCHLNVFCIKLHLHNKSHICSPINFCCYFDCKNRFRWKPIFMTKIQLMEFLNGCLININVKWHTSRWFLSSWILRNYEWYM